MTLLHHEALMSFLSSERPLEERLVVSPLLDRSR